MTNEITKRNFDEKYSKEGGVARLLEMYNQGASTSDIGSVFKLDNKRINYYLQRIVGEGYYRYPWRRLLSDVGFSPLHPPEESQERVSVTDSRVDPRLNEIDDSLYRVAVRALITQGNKILLVKEYDGDGWWAIPGGGIDHGESVEASLLREIEEELGVPSSLVACNFRIALYNIGKVVNRIPRMNIFFIASVPPEKIRRTPHVEQWAWFTKDEFLRLEDLNPSYDAAEIASVTFSSSFGFDARISA